MGSQTTPPVNVRPAGATRPRRGRRYAPALLALLLLPAPARADELSPRARGDLAIKARAVLKKHCAECHTGQAGRGAVRVMEHGNLIANGPNPVPFVAPGKVAASQLIHFLEDGSMPPGDRPRPTDEEVKTVKDWVEASAPGYPVSFDEPATLAAMLRDAEQHKDDAANLRYVSFAHLVADDGDLRPLHVAEHSVLRALTGLGIDHKAATPVDDTATLFRIDARDAKWNGRELFYRVVKGPPKDVYPLTPYDLILLEYPHAHALPPGHPLANRLDEYFADARLARRVPYLRGDWLGTALTPNGPLAADLKSLGELGTALRKQGIVPAVGKEENMPCGPVPRAFGGLNPVPPAPKPAAARPLVPLTALHTGDAHADPPPFTLTAEILVGDKPVISLAKETKFKLRVNASQQVHYVLLMVWSNGTVELQTTNKPGFLPAGVSELTTKDGDPFAITDILTGGEKATEYFVLLASADPIPAPVIVRSRHGPQPDCREKNLYPVSRFVFEPDAKLDPARVVRKVVPVTVTEK